MEDTLRPLAAEFIGTFAIFVGAGAATVLGPEHMAGIALAHGLTIMVFVAAFGDMTAGATSIPLLPSALRWPVSCRRGGFSHIGLRKSPERPWQRIVCCSRSEGRSTNSV